MQPAAVNPFSFKKEKVFHPKKKTVRKKKTAVMLQVRGDNKCDFPFFPLKGEGRGRNVVSPL
jgi:hypothetical protein